ncbi:hypothetical protein BD560DRAFT_398336 [Blakeslea trispora]|nr:hypothetical protein BD560DRAFT_398336 [Blakeslea trispora]
MDNNQLRQDAEGLRERASKIQSEQMKAGEDTSKGSFTASVQSVADKAIQSIQQESQPSLEKADISHVMSAETSSGESVKPGSFSAAAQSVADRIQNEENEK